MTTVLSEISEDGIATITLNRPQQHNAMDGEMVSQLNETLGNLQKNPHIRALVLKGNGKNFSAGADLSWMQKMVNFSIEENIKEANALGQCFYQLYHCKFPTIAVVQGAAIGGGVGLAAACQVVLASSEAKFCFSETKLGLVPALIMPYIINAIGVRQTRAYFLTAMPFDSQTALRLGLCQEVASPETLEDRLQIWLSTLLQNGPIALQTVNSLLEPLELLPITPLMVNITAEKIASVRVSDEGQEGLKAFLEKRKPYWIK